MKQAQLVRVRLGEFELDLRTGELRSGDETILLREQPLQVLRLLVEAEGELISREDIRKKLWPNDTIVEFDHSINAAIKNLRRSLGDSADDPKYIETLARRGYRLMVPVVRVASDDSAGEVDIGVDGAAVRLQADTSLLGKRVSHYRVLEIIGGGGMGLVYKAEDLKLGRQVALKFLPEDLVTNPLALQRFEREAKTASSLNHPNICTIHEVDEEDSKPFIVMELLEGETLRHRLAALAALKKTLPLDELLDVAVQICTGLEAAHAKGIIHRDIKPANIFLASSGQVKILDFGLAKAVDRAELPRPSPTEGLERGAPDGRAAGVERAFRPASAEDDLKGHGFSRADDAHVYDSHAQQNLGGTHPGTPEGMPIQDASPDGAPAQSHLPDDTLTRIGSALGTAGYMSPEQVRGEKLDARTDIFSFGLVLYEMATGQRAFGGETQALLGDAILTSTPVPVRDLNSALPLRLEIIIGKSLEKDRERRYQSAAEIRVELKKSQEEPEREAPKHSMKAWLAVAAAALLIAVLAGGLYWRYSRSRASQSASKLTSKDPIVLADFANSTGDPIFDGTLRQALAIQLEQSPFLNVLPDKQVSDTLKLMNRQPDEKLTPDIAREVCLRSNSKVFLKGSIARIGEQFLITEEAINCQTGETVASAESQAQNRNGVLQALQNVGNQLRQKLGESLSSIATLNQPLEKVTTSSLEALQEYALGDKVARGNNRWDCFPYFQRAIALDPNFALAYLELGLSYSDYSDGSLANSNFTKAYELRNRVSQRERLRIEGVYNGLVLGDQQNEMLAFKQIVQIYPEDWWAHYTLGLTAYRLGDKETAVTALEQAHRLRADDPYTLEMLGRTYVTLNRYQEGKAAIEQEEALTPDSASPRWDLWMVAFVEGDKVAMQQQLARAAGKRDENDVLRWQSCAEAYHGRLAKSAEMLQRAIDLAQQAKQFDLAGGWRADTASRHMELGNTAQALRDATEALQMGTSKEIRAAAALMFTRIGDPRKGREMAEALNREFPADTLLQHYYLPIIAAASEMRRGNPQKALELLDPASAYEKCDCGWWAPQYYAAYLRGLAYLELGQGQNAAVEFQKIIDHPGIVLSDITGALAHLQLGRAYAMAGDRAKAKAAYQDFLTLWKDADPDIPIYQQAKAEYAKLR